MSDVVKALSSPADDTNSVGVPGGEPKVLSWKERRDLLALRCKGQPKITKEEVIDLAKEEEKVSATDQWFQSKFSDDSNSQEFNLKNIEEKVKENKISPVSAFEAVQSNLKMKLSSKRIEEQEKRKAVYEADNKPEELSDDDSRLTFDGQSWHSGSLSDNEYSEGDDENELSTVENKMNTDKLSDNEKLLNDKKSFGDEKVVENDEDNKKDEIRSKNAVESDWCYNSSRDLFDDFEEHSKKANSSEDLFGGSDSKSKSNSSNAKSIGFNRVDEAENSESNIESMLEEIDELFCNNSESNQELSCSSGEMRSESNKKSSSSMSEISYLFPMLESDASHSDDDDVITPEDRARIDEDVKKLRKERAKALKLNETEKLQLCKWHSHQKAEDDDLRGHRVKISRWKPSDPTNDDFSNSCASREIWAKEDSKHSFDSLSSSQINSIINSLASVASNFKSYRLREFDDELNLESESQKKKPKNSKKSPKHESKHRKPFPEWNKLKIQETDSEQSQDRIDVNGSKPATNANHGDVSNVFIESDNCSSSSPSTKSTITHVSETTFDDDFYIMQAERDRNAIYFKKPSSSSSENSSRSKKKVESNDDVPAKANYDDFDEDLEYLRIITRNKQIKRKLEFIDDEASLSGDDVGSDGNVDEDGANEYEPEEGDLDEVPNNEKLIDGIHDLWQAQMKNNDNANMSFWQDRFFVDGVLHSKTDRTFRAKLRETAAEEVKPEDDDEAMGSGKESDRESEDDETRAMRVGMLKKKLSAEEASTSDKGNPTGEKSLTEKHAEVMSLLNDNPEVIKAIIMMTHSEEKPADGTEEDLDDVGLPLLYRQSGSQNSVLSNRPGLSTLADQISVTMRNSKNDEARSEEQESSNPDAVQPMRRRHSCSDDEIPPDLKRPRRSVFDYIK